MEGRVSKIEKSSIISTMNKNNLILLYFLKNCSCKKTGNFLSIPKTNKKKFESNLIIQTYV